MRLELQDSINKELCRTGWTLKDLSDHSGVPYETIKKLANAKIQNPCLNNILRIAEAFSCSVDHMLGREDPIIGKISELSEHSYQFLSAVIEWEDSLRCCPETEQEDCIPVIVPTGRMKDGMYFDSAYMEKIDISAYRKRYGDKLMCGLKITNQSFHPAYLQDDILLIGRDRHPVYGDTGVFLKNGKFYIRKYICGTPSLLEPINGVGRSIVFDEDDEWRIFGYVLTVYRAKRQVQKL